MGSWKLSPIGLLVLLALYPSLLAAEREAGIIVDKDKRVILIDAKIAPRIINDPRYKREDGKPYPIEVIACWPFPRGQKAHETVVTIDVKPSEVHKALEDLGVKAGKPVVGQTKKKAE